MWKKIAIAGGVGAVILGAGTAALAETGSTSTSPSASPSAGASKHGGHKRLDGDTLDRLHDVLHAQWVTKDAKNGVVTHDEIRGAVTAVSGTSITVQAADNVSETYTVTSTTKVHIDGLGKKALGTISQITVGEDVVVAGTGTTSLTANQVIKPGTPKKKAAPTPSVTPTPAPATS